MVTFHCSLPSWKRGTKSSEGNRLLPRRASDRPQSGSVGLEPIRELGLFVHRSHFLVVVLVVVLYICDCSDPADVTRTKMGGRC
jgi:hypothetical protein